MELINRIKSPTPDFFKKVKKYAVILIAIAVALIADNAVWNSLDTDKNIRIGEIAIPACAKIGASGNTAISDVFDIKIPYENGGESTSIKGMLKCVDGHTPDSEQTYTITLILDQN